MPGDRVRDPRRAWHHGRAHQQRRPAAQPPTGSPAQPCGARSVLALKRSSTTRSAPLSPCSPGAFVVDNLLFGLVPSVGRLIPDRASDALMGLRVQHLPSPGAGAIILIAWAGVLGVLGSTLSVRQDINSSLRRGHRFGGRGPKLY